jgi:hypothetical protein
MTADSKITQLDIATQIKQYIRRFDVCGNGNRPLCIMTSQGLMPARNAGLSSHRKLNNSKWALWKFSGAMITKTSIPRGHQALLRHYA